jgi:hypothetical protein
VEAHAAVRRGDDVASVGAPRLDDSVDGTRIEVGPIGENDERRIGIIRQRGKSAAQRRTGPALPLGAMDAVDVERVRAADDDHWVRLQRFEHTREQLDLLRRRRAVARRRSGGENDGVDVQEQPSSAAQRCWTFAM